jgi:hypothetical protein
MGVHHFKIRLVPLACFGRQLPVTLSESDLDRGEDTSSGWWALHPPSEDFLYRVRSLLPTAKPWPGGTVEEYVSDVDWGSDIRIWKDAGRVWGISFRFSPVADGWSLMQRFLQIARDGQCLLLEERSGALIEPDEGAVRERLASSRAMQFLRDPKSAILQSAKELNDDAG